MVKVLLSLKWAYVRAQFKGNTWAIIGTVFATIYGLGGVAAAAFAMFFLGREDAPNIGAGLLLLSALVTLLWWVVPIFISGVDATLDPDRLVLFPLKRRQIQLAQFGGAFIGIPGLLSLLGCLTICLALVRKPLVVPLALLGIAFQLALAVLVSRIATLVAYRLSSKRYVGTVLTILAFCLLLGSSPLLMMGINTLTGSWELARSALLSLAWTPLGAGIGFVSSAYRGLWLAAGAQLLLACLYCTIFWWLWGYLLTDSMDKAGIFKGRAEAKDVGSGKLGLLGKFPATTRGAIAARTVYVLVKDSRANANLYILPIMYLGFSISSRFMGAAGTGSGISYFILVFLPVTAGYVYAYLASYDSSAFALHVYSPVRGKDDRWGRAIGLLVPMLPIIGIGAIFMTLLTQSPVYLVINLGLSLGLLLAGVGISAVVDMKMSVPVPPPGSSPFKMPSQNDGFAKGMARMGIMLLILATGIPGYICYISFAITGKTLWVYAGGAASLLVGIALLLMGLRWGARLYDQKAPETLQRVSKFSS